MFTSSSYLNPYSNSLFTPPSSVYRPISQLHRRRNPPIPIPTYRAGESVIDENDNTHNNTNVQTDHYRVPITDLSLNSYRDKLLDVSVVHEKSTTRKANLKVRSPTNPFLEESESRKSDFGILDREWERGIEKRNQSELEVIEQEELNKALRESIEMGKERQKIEHQKREQEELELALRISEEEARQAEIYNELQRSFRLKKEESMKKGKEKLVVDENESSSDDSALKEQDPSESPTILTRPTNYSKSKIILNPEPSLPYPNTTQITINMRGKQRFMRRFCVDESVGEIRNWYETFNTPQYYTMKITSPTYLAGTQLTEVDMTKSIQDMNLYPHGEISIEPCYTNK